MQLRSMTIEDYEKVYDLWSNTPGVGLSEADEQHEINSFLERNPGLFFVYESFGEIIGTILCGTDGRRGYIHHLVIKESYRGRGLGKQLVQRCLDGLKKLNILKCHLFVFANNEIGKGFWSGTGWQRREDILIYSKNI
ncbi:MAG: GNAT family N-acetyltransferase [Clostridiales bacterium GWB2_37_7]|nr:MAG: GNAT family N-acetyltransferase [Clostridiales bacterium GWB2_37_7]